MTPSFLLGAGGKLILANGKPLSLTPGQPPTTGITLTPFFLNTSQAADAHFNIQATAASNDTTGNVPYPFTYTGGAPSSVYARIMAADGVTEVVTWTDITASVQADGAGNGLGYINNVPAGVGYKRQIRSGAFTSNDAAPFNIGVMMLPWGQSNMRGTLDGGIGQSNPVPGTAYTEVGYFDANAAGAFFGEGGFVGSSNNNAIGSYTTNQGGGLSLLRLVGTQLQAKSGRKVGVSINPWAQNGTAMVGFMSSGGVLFEVANSGTANGTMGFSSPKNIIANGDYRIVAWHQGESDSASITRAQRLADLKQFCQSHLTQVAKFGRSPSQLTFLFALMGVGSPPQMEVLRAAVLDLVAYGATQGWDVRIGWNCIDLDPGNATPPDSLHFGGADQTRSVRRLTQAMMNVLDPANVPKGAAGPRLTGAYTRSGDDITLTVAHEGGTGLAAKTPGSAITGWYANTAADFSGTDIALTNVTIVDATHVKVTATGAPATFYIKHCGGKFYTAQSYHPDVSNLIYDNFVYPTGANAGDQFTGLPLQPTPDAIKVG